MQSAIQPVVATGDLQYAAAAHPHNSAVAWGAIFAGAAAASALSLILLILGVGLGVSAISPWASLAGTAEKLAWGTVAWVTLTALAASGLGGYLAGRLRVRWAGAQLDEVYFRDTAHGLLAWAIATLLTAALLTSTIAAVVGGTVRLGAQAAGGAVSAGAGVVAGMAGPPDRAARQHLDYYTMALLRGSEEAPPAADPVDQPTDGEGTDTDTPMPAADFGNDRPGPRQGPWRARGGGSSGLILHRALAGGTLGNDDRDWLTSEVAQRTGLSKADATARVDQVWNQLQAEITQAAETAKELAEKTRKATAYASLWLFISLLGGAFVSSLFATFGGRQRDL